MTRDSTATPRRGSMGFEARLQDGFAWANAHGREIMVGIGVALLVGGAGGGRGFEWREPRSALRRRPSSRGSRPLHAGDGREPAASTFVPEPANAEQAEEGARGGARRARRVHRRAHGSKRPRGRSRRSTRRGDRGRPRPARRTPTSGSRRSAGSLGPDDPRRAVALRLRGYVLDQSGRSAGRGRGLRGRRADRGVSAARAALDRSRRLLRARQAPDARDRRVPRGARHGAGALGAAARDPADRDPAGADRFRAAAGATGAGRRGTGSALKGPGRRIVRASRPGSSFR